MRVDARPVGLTGPGLLAMDITVHQLKRRLDEGHRLLLLDCREASEVAICALPDAMHIPMRQTATRIEQLPRDRPIVVYCHHGIRSQPVAKLLSDRGFDAVSLAGGIDAWSTQIDPSVQRY